MFGTASKLICLSVAISSVCSVYAVNIEVVAVGDPGNVADDTGKGAVDFAFSIGKTEISKKQYVEFLNSVAASDPFELFSASMSGNQSSGITRSGAPGSYSYALAPPVVGEGIGGSDYVYDDKPVAFVSLFSAFRFANWLHNGQGNGDTEDGAYTLLGGTSTPSNLATIARNPGAKWWIPSDDEWYKAAYYDPDASVYYDYPTGTDDVPNDSLPSADTGNSANFSNAIGNSSYPLTDVGAYAKSASAFGTLDQAGNVWEWTDTLAPRGQGAVSYLRGGWWALGSDSLLAVDTPSHFENPGRRPGSGTIGFRVATSVPEPSAVYLALAISLATLICARSW